MLDVADLDATEQLARAADAVHNLLGSLARGDPKDGAVLVHCVQGISRSAAVTMAYLVRHEAMTLVQAARLVREKRYQSYPNVSFWRSLRRIEMECREGACSVPEEALQLHQDVLHLREKAAEAVANAGKANRGLSHQV